MDTKYYQGQLIDAKEFLLKFMVKRIKHYYMRGVIDFSSYNTGQFTEANLCSLQF